ncbi:hypothetical protein BSK62_02790 [Paenibacillus odorifer]|uniref:DUF7657 domain-containing protein n=1 Tax=Paenibacillus odorifer TaxID=189426 RepID=UPI00096F6BAA|nr:hypothetical protein [Paenibacillus odorifer]OMD68450.1 hypothetical protein BSK62_02790 [Paenibacillus odorifer]
MKYITKTHKKVILFIILIVLMNVAIFTSFRQSVNLSIYSENDSKISFFYDNGHPDYPFDDSHMSQEYFVKSSKVQNVKFPLDIVNSNKLRIDFGDTSGNFKIYSLSIQKSPLYEYVISEKVFLDKFKFKNDISQYSFEDGTVNIASSGPDGHIYSTDTYSNLPIKFKNSFLIKELFIACIALFILFINKLLLIFRSLPKLPIYYKTIKEKFVIKNTFLKNAFNLIIIICISIISAVILDVVILRSIAKVSGFFNFDTAHRYFLNSYVFSFDRIYFFSSFIFIIGLIVSLGKSKAHRYRYVLAFILLILMVLGKFTGSSLGFYDGMLQGNTPSYQQSTLLGNPQGIRGDEWATEKPYYFAQTNANPTLQYFNKNLSFTGTDMVISAFAPVKDITVIARPDLWGFMVMPNDYAFSFYWTLRLILLFMASYEMGVLLTKKQRFGIITAIVITFAPPVQWWLSQALMLMLMSGQFAIVLFNKYLNSKKLFGKFISLSGLALFALVYILTMYPATQVPLGYVFLMLFIYVLIENKKNKPFAFSRLLQYAVMLIPIALVLYHFYSNSKPALHVIMNTVYPGSDRPWIKLPWDFELYQFVNIFTASIKQPDFLNASEISQFFTFTPFVIIVATTLIFKNKKKSLLMSLLLSVSLFLMLVSWIPEVPFFNKITLLSFTYPVRITYAYGYSFTLLIVCLLAHLEDKRENLFTGRMPLILSSVICFLTLCIMTNSINIFSYFKSFSIGTILMILVVVLLSYMGFLLMKGNYNSVQSFIVLYLLLSVCSTIMVNPITKGTDSMFEKTTMEQIRKINSVDAGRWMVSGSPTISNLVTAQGVARTTGTYYYPDWEMMSIIDKKHEHINLWNQFAHIDMRLTDGDLEFSLLDHERSLKVNGTNRIIYTPIETARDLKIKYIFTMIPIPQSIIDKGEVTLLYKDSVDPWSIYRINY